MFISRDIDTVYFDVDDTLVMWDNDATYADPAWDSERILIDGLSLIPHYTHIRLLKYHKARGRQIVVWSAGGSRWAQDVISALKLNQYVDVIINKPRWFYDDLPVEAGIGRAKYSEPPTQPKFTPTKPRCPTCSGIGFFELDGCIGIPCTECNDRGNTK